MQYRYRETVEKIKGLRWDLVTGHDLLCLMLLSYYAAREFAESLRIALEDNPDNEAFQKMAAGELQTNNLKFEEYRRLGDHADFLKYFLGKHCASFRCGKHVHIAGHTYTEQVQAMPREVRIMSVVSRERELSDIFAAVLKAKGWDQLPELKAFRYYLEQHIILDSEEGGHADLLAGFEVNDEVNEFYRARLEMYECLPILFSA